MVGLVWKELGLKKGGAARAKGVCCGETPPFLAWWVNVSLLGLWPLLLSLRWRFGFVGVGGDFSVETVRARPCGAGRGMVAGGV